MNENTSPLLLVGVGGAGCSLAATIARQPRVDAATLLADSDASAARPAGLPFVLLGGDRLAGRGTGGDMVLGRLAAEDSSASVAERLQGVRLAVVAAGLGGGTGGGSAPEIVSQITSFGIPVIAFATMPFSFEGDDRRQKAQRAAVALEEAADATVVLPLEALAGGRDATIDEAMAKAAGSFSSAVSFFWRMLGRPGYIKIDIERARRVISGAGRGRFAAASGARGEGRAAAALDMLARSPLLSAQLAKPRRILCGILAGDDLTLRETGEIAEGVRDLFGRSATFDLATVNDEESFGGQISVAALAFESSGDPAAADGGAQERKLRSRQQARRGRRASSPLALSPQGRGRFNNVEPTVWNGEDLDIPTFIRRNISLDL